MSDHNKVKVSEPRIGCSIYIGCKQIAAWPEEKDGKEGYGVQYPDGYVSWSPKETFESAYIEMKGSTDGSKITEEMVDAFITTADVTRMGNHTVVKVNLVNGFTLIEESACVSAENYNETLGAQYAIEKAKEKIWYLLGFLLATARNGITLYEGE